MKYLSVLFIGLGFMGFIVDVSDHDLNYLYQNWRWMRWEATSNQQLTYNPSSEFGNSYGYQFRKDGTVSICRGISYCPAGMNFDFEVVDGNWKMVEDSIISLSYTSNNTSYGQQLVIRKLNAFELIVHPISEN